MGEKWSIIRSGRALSLERAGIRECVLTRQSTGEESLSLQLASNATPFYRDEPIAIQRNGRNWFQGVVTFASRSYTGNTSRMDVDIAGPWREFAERTFICSWKNGDSSQMVPRGFVGLGGDAGTRAAQMTTGAWLNELAERVKTVSAQQNGGLNPFLVGTINVPVDAPTQKLSECSFADAWQKVAEYTPSLVTWFEHTEQYPTLNAMRAGNLPAVTLTLGENKVGSLRGNVSKLDVSRARMTPAGVCIVLRKQTERTTEAGDTVFDTTWREIKFPSDVQAGWRNVLTFTADETQEDEAERWGFPDDLARNYFEHLSGPSWEGSATWQGDGVLDTLNPGWTLNIAGTENTEHATMRGVIFSASHDVMRGTSTVRFGPPDSLGFDTYRQWLAWQRRRRLGLDADTHHIDEMTTGESDEESYGFGDDERPRKIGYARREIGWCENGVGMVGTFLVKNARPQGA